MEEKRINDDVELYLASDEPAEANIEPIAEENPIVEPKTETRDTHEVVRVGEVPEFRERNKKRFKMSDGTEQEVFYASDVHVLDDEAGRYDDIEDTLTEDEDGKYLVCGKHCFIAKFSNDEKNDELFSIEQGKHKVTVLAKKNYKNKNKGRKPDVRKRDFDSESESKVVSFSEIESDSIYEYTIESTGVKENIIVKGPKKTYRYPFILKCENVKAIIDSEQKRIAFNDAETNEEVFHIPTPFMVDNNNIASMAVSYELVEKDNGDAVLTVIADSEWMNDKERAFPVVIDPQIKVTNTTLLATYSWNSNNYMYSAAEHTVGVVATATSTDTSYEEIDCSCTVNNSMKDAIDLTYNRWTLGTIASANDFVWYKFIADVDEAHNGECIGNYTFYTSGSLDTMGYLYDASGNQIGYNDDSNGRNFAISANLTYGETYYLKVKAWSSNTGSYKVSFVATDKYCCGELSSDTPTYTYSRHRMYLDFNYPSLSLGARIKKAELKVYRKRTSATSANAQLGLYHINDEICDYCYYEPSIEGSLIDYDAMNASGSNLCYTFDITTLIDRLNKSETYNNKFVLKLIDETLTSNNNVVLYGASSAYKPELVITYEPNYAVNTSYQAHTHTLGKFGQAAIDLQYGNLTFDSTDFSWAGNRMPVTIKHLYNSILGSYKYTYNSGIKLYVADFSAMNVGYGFKLNIMQSMRLVGDEYIYTDENGAETVLTLADDCTYKNEDGDMSFDSCNLILTIGNEERTFDASGRLINIKDSFGNTNKINYTSGRITSVVDGAGRIFEFNYSGNNLVSIVAPDGTSVQYTYSGNYLSTVTYPDGNQVFISYTYNKPTSVILKDASGNSVYKVVYAFSGYKVTSATEYGVENGTFVQGSKSTYSYSMASKRTTVTTTELEDDCDGGNVIKTVYTFDDDGNVISDYVYSEDTGNTGVDDEVSGIHPYSADSGASIIRNNTNMLYNHTFASYSTAYWEVANECCSSTNMYITSLSDKFRKFAMAIDATDSTVANNTVYQNTVSLAAGEYTFSAYVRVARKFIGDNPGAFIRVSTSGGTVLAVSEKLTNTNSQYIRLIAPFEIDYTQSVKVEFVLDGDGLVYVCAPQLENNPFANDYNMLQNGNFEMSYSYWAYRSANCSVSTSTRFNLNRSMYMIGDVNSTRYCGQIIYPIYDRSVRETFTLSGWAKGYGLPMHERNGSRVPTFRLRAVIRYSDGTTETHTADFSSCTEEWQFTSLQFSKEKFKYVSYIYIYCDYDYNSGYAYFDDIQLVRNSIETGVTANDFVVEAEDDSDYEDTDTGDSTDSTESEGFAEVIDAFGNVITETTFTDGEFGTIYRAFGFNTDDARMDGDNAGNDLVSETDARGNKTKYTVDADTSRNEEVTDRCGNKTAYEYDDAGRTTKVTSKNADGAEIAHVSYAYDAFDNMTEIARGDGMKYALKYNAFHNLESIGIDGKAESLIKYTYKNGNGRLKEIAYANGDRMAATYNSVGQLVAEKWYNSTKTLIAHYKYVYDNSGNIVRSIDILGEKEYNYIYNEGSLIEAITYSIELNDEIVVGKSILNTLRYVYDDEGKQTKKILTLADGTEQVYLAADENNSTSEFIVGDNSIKTHSKTDSFGRKVFDEFQLGSGFISRQFSYHAGEETREHKENEKLMSSPTTQLVSEILLSDGRTLSYEYDAEERITSVTESYKTADNKTITNITEYTYDALGQLLTETVNGSVVNSMKYDNYGNIVSKNGKEYLYDTTWRDLLKSYDGYDIEYDAQGNPVKYLGHTLTWEKGRQLKSFDNNTYTYNANGIRTSKTVNGVKHEYTLDGTKILRETWNGNTLVPIYDSEDSVCGIIYNGTPHYFLKNLQGDIIAIANAKGEVEARYTYDAWGAITNISGTDEGISIAVVNPFRYRGYYYDVEIGLYYLQSRYYDPQVGRFINDDEPVFINMPKSVMSNIFAYCSNRPIDQTDYTGFAIITISITAIITIVKAVVSIFLLACVIYAVTMILTDRNFQKSVSTALSNTRPAVKTKFENVVIACVTAYAIAKTLSKINKYEVHHIVAQSAQRAAPARKQLKAVEININSSTNKVSIKYNLHKRLHTATYYDAVNGVIDKAYDSGSSGAKQRIIDTLNAIKNVLLTMSESTP